jgi:4-hydroxy-tetrahydrodipicolinate synthase
MKTNPFYGVHTALVTPMLDGRFDYASMEQLIEHQISGGIQGVVAVGTTGESPTLTHKEHNQVIAETVRLVGGRVPVLAGTGSNATYEAVELTGEADRAGADGFLLVAPYYNKPSQEGLYLHFAAIAEVTAKPIVLYSIPSRCGIEIGATTMARLHERYPHIIGIKEAGGSCDRISAIRQTAGEDFLILSGDDGLTLPFMTLGAKGVISVASNWVVSDLVSMVSLALDNRFQEAGDINRRYQRLFRDLFLDPNPVPIKHTLHRAGLIASPEVRLPLAPISEATRETLDSTLQQLGL